MSLVSRNIVANLASRGWTAALGMVFPPVFVRLMGVESYGLVGLFTTISALFVVVDLGLARTIQRDLALADASDAARVRAKCVVRTYEVIFCSIAVLMASAIAVAAPFITSRWLNIRTLDMSSAVSAVRLMGAAAAVTWTVQMYAQVLIGLQRQVLASALSALANTVRVVGAAVVLWKVRPSVVAFFLWTLAVSCAWLVTCRAYAVRSVSASGGASRFDVAVLRDNWRSSLQLWLSSAASVALAQVDRLVASAVLSLGAFGYYSLAATAAAGLQLMVLPVWNAVFPRMCQLSGDRSAFEKFYGRVTQFLVILVCPSGLVLSMFARDVLFAWTGDLETARSAASALAGLAASAALSGMASLPYAAQVAHGATRLPLFLNGGALVVAVPATVLAGRSAGGGGVAWASAGVALVVLAANVIGTHSVVLRGTLRAWAASVSVPAAAAVVTATLIRLSVPAPHDRLTVAVYVVCSGLASLAAAVLASRDARARLAAVVRGVRVYGAYF